MYRKLGSLLLTVFVISGCTVTAKQIRPEIKPGLEYDTVYPHYIQLCAVSQIRAKFAQHGGSPSLLPLL